MYLIVTCTDGVKWSLYREELMDVEEKDSAERHLLVDSDIPMYKVIKM